MLYAFSFKQKNVTFVLFHWHWAKASDSEENTYSPTESDALAPLLNLMALMRRIGLPTI